MKPSEVEFIAITFDDGTVGIMQFVTCEYLKDDTPRWTREPSDKNIAEEIARSSFDHAVVSWRRLDRAHVPQDRTFRNAWHDPDGAGPIKVHMGRAREIHRGRLRERRAPLLAKLDTEYMRADEAGDAPAKKAIAARKQALRDVTADPRIDAAKTPDELAAVVPDALVDRVT
jgi:hypothetical protein